MLEYQFRPLNQWPGQPTKQRRRSQFSAGWTSTLHDLERELQYLRAKNIVLQATVTADEIRNDGMLRANARPRTPQVIISFDSKHGPLSYPCDTFDAWQDNVRAIALALKALRDVDRYGVTRRAEQYTGWARLPPPRSELTQEVTLAAATLIEHAKSSEKQVSRENVEDLYRAACLNVHPDRGGNAKTFSIVNEAMETLRRHFGLSA